MTADELTDPTALDIETTVNGEIRQRDNTRNLFGDISAALTLEPGDVIATGTPSGVAWGMALPRYLQTGDIVEIMSPKSCSPVTTWVWARCRLPQDSGKAAADMVLKTWGVAHTRATNSS